MNKFRPQSSGKDRPVRKFVWEVARAAHHGLAVLGHPLLSTEKEEKYGRRTDRYFDLILIGALPTWPYSKGRGYYPSSGLGLILLILIILLLMGRI